MYVTERLEVRAVDEADIAGLLDVYLSNPQVIAVTEGSAGEPGHYDRGMLERDLWVSELDENRHTAGLFLRDGGTCVGVLDWTDGDAGEGTPSIGLVLVHRAHQRRGYGREAVVGLIGACRESGWTRLRATALAGDPATTGLYEAVGMREVERRAARFAAGGRSVAVFELEL
jgi:RimJ/RimL family protein N-acetyltransferase